jgi:5-(carboxyamino)imidazole ribonucleotide synthase
MKSPHALVPPPATLGILGGGQLGRMTALAARAMGYRVAIFDPSPTACAAPVADRHIVAGYGDTEALRRFAALCDRVGLEFENVPPSALETVMAAGVPVHPSPAVLAICRNRQHEKEFLAANGIPCAPFRVVTGAPAVLKTADSGYDGKGQIKIDSAACDCGEVWARLGAPVGVFCGMSAVGADEADAVVHRHGERATVEDDLRAELESQVLVGKNGRALCSCRQAWPRFFRVAGPGLAFSGTRPESSPARRRRGWWRRGGRRRR